MHDALWFLTRATGVVAMALVAAAIIDGLIFSGREAGKKRLRPAWWLDLHRGLGGYALIFTALHVLTAFGSCDTILILSGGQVPKPLPHILELAKRGAEQRYDELQTELAQRARDLGRRAGSARANPDGC